jgi:2-amino-4-hydroxy-6-hydroxymethyldihydropteridine diphosphokinase
MTVSGTKADGPAPSAGPTRHATAYIGLGANLGDSVATLHHALRDLAAIRGVEDCVASPFYRSAPVDASGPDFINAVACLRTTLAPLDLLDALQTIELLHGRERPYRNAPRTLDLDLLIHGDLRLDTPRLTLPHPRMRERAFVLLPLRDLAPGMILDNETLDELLTRCGDQAIQRLAEPPARG